MSDNYKARLEQITPRQALESLIAGNRRFVKNLQRNHNLLKQVNETSKGQYPFAVILSCMDSRTSAELIFDQGLGEIFSLRIAGNVVNEDIIGSIDFACDVVGSKLIVVLGHTRCGAVTAACDGEGFGSIKQLLMKIQPAIDAARVKCHTAKDADAIVKTAVEENVLVSLNEILDRSQVVSKRHRSGEVGLVGGIYSVETGEVRLIDERF